MMICLPVAFLGVGATELLLVLLVALVLLGPREIPRIARTLGSLMANLRAASDDLREQVMHLDEEAPDKAADQHSPMRPAGLTSGGHPLSDAGPLPAGPKKDSQDGHTV